MDDSAAVREIRVWVVVGEDCKLRAIGLSAVDAWRNFFDHVNVMATLDEMSRSLGHDDFRCVACRLVPDNDAVWDAAAAASGDLEAADRMGAGRRAAVWGMADG